MHNTLKELTFLILIIFSYETFSSEKQTINVLAFGDGGTGTQTQRDIARSMERVCSELDCDFGLLLGDNIYENGVDGVNDEQFINKFEVPYSPLKIPFYAVIGNHDNRGDTDAQVNYTKRSQWWRMPDEYYSKEVGNILLVGINSNDFDSRQEKFVKEALEESNAKWKVVFGHHPVRSYGAHGDTLHLKRKLLPLLCENDAIYISGHDHDLQVLKSDCGTPLIVSGAAAKLRATKKGSRSLFAKSAYGYTVMSFGEDVMDLTLYGRNDEILYENSYGNFGKDENIYFKALREGESAQCDPPDVLFGLRYKNTGDDHTSGIYCLISKENKTTGAKGSSHELEDRDGREYDAFCGSSDMAITGVLSEKGRDRHIKEFICKKREQKENKTDIIYYLQIDSKLGRHKEMKCQTPFDAVVGFKFDDVFDQHIEGIFCG